MNSYTPVQPRILNQLIPEGTPLHFTMPENRTITIKFIQEPCNAEPKESQHGQNGTNTTSLWERFKVAFHKADNIIEKGVQVLGYPLKYAGISVMLGGTVYMFFILLSTMSLAAVVSSGAFLLLLGGAILYQLGKDLTKGQDSSNTIGSGMYLPLPLQFKA
jgi:hypothetical protein